MMPKFGGEQGLEKCRALTFHELKRGCLEEGIKNPIPSKQLVLGRGD